MCVAITDHVNGSDSDTNLDDNDANDAPEYYQPISAADDDDEEDSGRISDSADEDRHENGEAEFLENGNYCSARQAENGMSSLHLNDDAERNKSSSEDEEEEEEAERMREAADSAMTRAFREDENRRNAPLTPENAMRVMEAMRGISFDGFAPDWADRVPENHWIDQLRSLRHPPRA